jgi:uncharacterized protein (TIGR02145 family)
MATTSLAHKHDTEMILKDKQFRACLTVTLFFLVFIAGCRKDERVDFGLSGSVKDSDGNSYMTFIMDNQEWMAENLKTTRYNDGRQIDSPGSDDAAWSANRSGAYSWYDNDQDNRETFGALYNWHAVNSGKLCPSGWHVPSDTEWTIINKYLAGNAGGKLKEGTSGHWHGTAPDNTGETGFNALPGGVRIAGLAGSAAGEGYFCYRGRTGRWWSSNENSASDAWHRSLHFDSGSFYRGLSDKGSGYSVRCMRYLK